MCYSVFFMIDTWYIILNSFEIRGKRLRFILAIDKTQYTVVMNSCRPMQGGVRAPSRLIDSASALSVPGHRGTL